MSDSYKVYASQDYVNETVDEKIAEAMASGDFGGEAGEDGVSATHSWNGTVLTITSASGTSSADLKGDKGDTGPQGPQGPQGDKGDKGDTGETGATGKDGTSVTVLSVSESSADGGSNIVTFSDGKTITIKNGSKGSKGDTGDSGSDGVSAAHSWSGTTLTITSASGSSSADLKGDKGETGERGFSVLRVMATPIAYTTTTGGFTPSYRIALGAVKSHSKASEVKVGDTLLYSYYTYPIGYVDDTYVYLGTGTTIRGAAGATPVKGTDYYTEAERTQMIADVTAGLSTVTVTGTDENDVTHTWTLYGVAN